MDIEILKDASAIAVDVATVCALLFGALWTYFHFLRGRTYTPRLELEVEGVVAEINSATCVRVHLQVANVGLSRVNLTQEGAGILFSAYPQENFKAVTHQALWAEPTVFPILEKHDWIEPRERLDEEVLIAVPTQKVIAWKIEAVLVNVQLSGTRLRWSANDIVLNTRD